MSHWAEPRGRRLNPLPATDAIFLIAVEHEYRVAVLVMLAGKSPQEGFTIRLVLN